MLKSSVSSFFECQSTDQGRNERPRSLSLKTSTSQFFHPNSTPAPRTSILASVVPKLRRLDVSDEVLTHPKLPLLTLKLSSPSFLDSTVNDDFTTEPLYFIKTLGPSTTIERADPRAEGNATTTTADIQWPKSISSKGTSDGILIQLRGAGWKGGESLLRRGALPGSSRRFNIPNYSHTMKWKRVGASYWCITAAVKGPIAIFEPSNASSPPRLVVFETLHDRYDARQMLVHRGVSLLLLDYLLVTCLLLVTEAHEWKLVQKHQGEDVTVPTVDTNSSVTAIPNLAPRHISTSALQWRKVMFGEPLYRKRCSSPSSVSSFSTTEGDVISSTPSSMNDTTAQAWTYDHVWHSSSSDTSPITGDQSDHAMFSSARTRSQSPSSESIFYPLTPASAPSHTYLDPSFYGESYIPPVPSIPDWCKSPGSSSGLGSASRSISEWSVSSSKQPRVLPSPPAFPITHRPQSTPPQAMTSLQTNGEPTSIPVTPTRLIPEHSEPHNGTARGSPRRLPRPPPTFVAQSHMSPQGRSRSHSQSMQPAEKWHPQYRQRTLPLPPVNHSMGSRFEQGFLQETQKDAETEFAEWVHALTSPAPLHHLPAPIPRTSFDHPPPAYNSIDFHGKVKLSNSSLPLLSSRVDP